MVGVGRTRKNLNVALKLGVIDEASQDAARAVRDADMVLIGTPVGQMAGVMKAIAPHLGQKTIITDGGSTKQDVIACARNFWANISRALCRRIRWRAPSIAARRRRLPELYRGRKVILVPQPETSARALQRSACGVGSVRRECGALAGARAR